MLNLSNFKITTTTTVPKDYLKNELTFALKQIYLFATK